MVGAPPLTLEQRAKVTLAFADAILVELGKLPPLTHGRRDRMLRAGAAVIEAGQEADASPDDLIPHFAMVFALMQYRAKGRRRTRKHGRPRHLSILFPSKEAKRRMAREERHDGEGRRGPRRGTIPLPANFAKALRVMLDRMIREPKLAKNTAAHGALWKIGVRPADTDVKRLVRAWDRAGYAADLPAYRRHRVTFALATNAENPQSAFSGETLSS